MRIVLCMIVKNEGKIIQRCLESVIGIIDEYCIVDTGSDDDTPALINSFLILKEYLERFTVANGRILATIELNQLI